LLHIHPKSNKKVNNNRGAHCQKGDIDEIFTDSRSGNTHTLPNSRANAKDLPLDKVPETVHIAKLNQI
jgi:hypothetical protein